MWFNKLPRAQQVALLAYQRVEADEASAPKKRGR